MPKPAPLDERLLPKMSQEDYLEILFNDLLFDRRQRNHWLSSEMKRPIRFLDQLDVKEKSVCIRTLIDMKPTPPKLPKETDDE